MIGKLTKKAAKRAAAEALESDGAAKQLSVDEAAE
jgi:hypothetical protein